MMVYVPWISRRRERKVKRWSADGKFMQRSLAENDRPSRTQSGNNLCVRLRYMVKPDFRMTGCRDTCYIDDVLDGNRHAMQWSSYLAAPNLSLRMARCIQNTVRVNPNECIQLPVQFSEAPKQRLHEFYRREFPGLIARTNLGRGQPVDISHLSPDAHWRPRLRCRISRRQKGLLRRHCCLCSR